MAAMSSPIVPAGVDCAATQRRSIQSPRAAGEHRRKATSDNQSAQKNFAQTVARITPPNRDQESENRDQKWDISSYALSDPLIPDP